jgi:hypothetical protein
LLYVHIASVSICHILWSEGRVGDALLDVEDVTGTDGERGAISAGWKDGASLGVRVWPFRCRRGAAGEGRSGGSRLYPGSGEILRSYLKSVFLCLGRCVCFCVLSLRNEDGCLNSEGHQLEGEGAREGDTNCYMCTLPQCLSVTFSGRRGESEMDCLIWRM